MNTTPIYDWQKHLTVNSDSTANFGALSQVASKPSNLIGNAAASEAHDNLMAEFFGTGDENSTFEVRAVLVEPCAGGGFNKTVIGKWTATLSAAVGATGCLLSASERLVDTLVVATEFEDLEGVLFRTVSPGNDCAAHILFDRMGGRYVTFEYKCGVNCTGANSIWREV